MVVFGAVRVGLAAFVIDVKTFILISLGFRVGADRSGWVEEKRAFRAAIFALFVPNLQNCRAIR